jgi:hypothetical protein
MTKAFLSIGAARMIVGGAGGSGYGIIVLSTDE